MYNSKTKAQNKSYFAKGLSQWINPSIPLTDKERKKLFYMAQSLKTQALLIDGELEGCLDEYGIDCIPYGQLLQTFTDLWQIYAAIENEASKEDDSSTSLMAWFEKENVIIGLQNDLIEHLLDSDEGRSVIDFVMHDREENYALAWEQVNEFVNNRYKEVSK